MADCVKVLISVTLIYVCFAAQLIGAWIVTGGTHAGVMKHVGEAVRNHTLAQGNKKPISAIGIAPWGCISNRRLLVNKQVSRSFCFTVLYHYFLQFL